MRFAQPRLMQRSKPGPISAEALGPALLALLLLTACGGSGNADGPGAVSVDEAKALDQAAEMLEERRLPEGALEQAPTADVAEPQSTPTDQASPAGS